jgi:hypothetical protein
MKCPDCGSDETVAYRTHNRCCVCARAFNDDACIDAAIDSATPLAPPMAQAPDYVLLLKKIKKLPPMTEEERIEQTFSFAWGNAAIEWPDPPPISFDKFRADGWRDRWRKAQEQIGVAQSIHHAYR